jgi:UV DNA damage endonuclease
MKLGLVCMKHNQSFKKGFVGLNSLKQSKEVTRKLYEATKYNITQTYSNIQYCIDNDISAYRVSSEIIPFYEYWDWGVVIPDLNKIKNLATKHNITLIIHPDQFCVLNSPDENVISASKVILNHHYQLCEHIGIEHIILHTGGVYNDKDTAISRFIDNFLTLPIELQNLIRLENCHQYDINEVLLISDLCGVEVCLDFHHERIIHNEIDITTHLLNLTRVISRNKKQTICHISSGKKSPTDKSHADYISEQDTKLIKTLSEKYPDVIFEVEAKFKNLAIDKIKFM